MCSGKKEEEKQKGGGKGRRKEVRLWLKKLSEDRDVGGQDLSPDVRGAGDRADCFHPVSEAATM
jgi:hypothetical protein